MRYKQSKQARPLRRHRIWTHHIRGIEFHDDFQSETCQGGDSSEPRMAATIAAGEVDADVYKTLDEHGAVVVGGANPVRLPTQPTLSSQSLHLTLLCLI